MSGSMTNNTMGKGIPLTAPANAYADKPMLAQRRRKQSKAQTSAAQRAKDLAAVERATARAKPKASKKKQQKAKDKMLMSDTSYAKHKCLVQYLEACRNPRIRGQIAVFTRNPLPTNNAVPYYAECLQRFAVGPNATTIVHFPLGMSSEWDDAGGAMDGVSFHQQFTGVGSNPDLNLWGNGVIGSILSNGSTVNPAAMFATTGAGVEVLPATYQSVGYTGFTWDGPSNGFPVTADVRERSRRHLRQAFISGELIFSNETPVSEKGGAFYVWEPLDNQSPIDAQATTLTGSFVRELPTFRIIQSDNELHYYTVVGNKTMRSYTHDQAPPTAMPTVAAGTLNINNKNSALNLMFVNTTSFQQNILVQIRTNWSVGGPAVTTIGSPVPALGEAAPIAATALDAANAAGTVSSLVKSAVSAVADPGARSALLQHASSLAKGGILGTLKAIL